MKKVPKRKATPDPLSGVRIEPPKTADQARADAEQMLSDAANAAAEVAEDALSVTEIAATAARVRAEKQRVSAPAQVPQKRLPRYTVMADRTVTWRGQQLRLKAGKSVVSDEKQGPGAVARFQAMGIKLEEVK